MFEYQYIILFFANKFDRTFNTTIILEVKNFGEIVVVNIAIRLRTFLLEAG